MCGSFNANLFHEFIQGLVGSRATQPWPGKNSVIVMDNCAIHKNDRVYDEITDAYVAPSFFKYSLTYHLVGCNICFCHHILLTITLLNLPSQPLKARFEPKVPQLGDL